MTGWLLRAGALLAVAPQAAPPLSLEQTVPLPGVEGRIDHMAYDAAGERLFISALGNDSVEVVDLRKGERVLSITGLGAPQGIVYVPESDRLYVANDNGGVLNGYDARTFQPVGMLNLEDDADNVRYDKAAKKLYVGFGGGGIAAVDAQTGKQAGSFKLSSHPEAFELEKGGSRMFVNVPGARRVAVIDRRKGRVVAEWKTGSAFGNFPMALDEAGHRLFVGCRLPARLVVLDTGSGAVVSKTEMCGDADELFYDARRHRVYAVCGAGRVEVIEQRGPDAYKTVAEVETAEGARTGLFVPERDLLFVAVPRRGTRSAEVRAYRLE